MPGVKWYLALAGSIAPRLCADGPLWFQNLPRWGGEGKKQCVRSIAAARLSGFDAFAEVDCNFKRYSPRVCSTTVSSTTSSCTCCWNAWKWKRSDSPLNLRNCALLAHVWTETGSGCWLLPIDAYEWPLLMLMKRVERICDNMTTWQAAIF